MSELWSPPGAGLWDHPDVGCHQGLCQCHPSVVPSRVSAKATPCHPAQLACDISKPFPRDLASLEVYPLGIKIK